MACRVLNLQRVQTTQADKAWQVLSSGQFSCRNYVKPGKTVPVVKDINDKSSQNVRKTTQQSPSYKQNNITGCMQIHKNSSGTNAKLNEPAKCTGSSLPFHPSNVAETGKVARGQNEGYTPTCNRFHAQATNGIFSNRIVSTSQAKGSGGTSPDCIDDDDILELGLCPEASNHLQDMKDKLIALSNELLDNVADLSSNEIEKLRQERLQLNKQVQQLEKYLRSTSVDEERQKSQFSASTAPSRAFQYETPPTSAFRIDSMRSNAQSHIVNGAVGYDGWNSSSFSFSSVDRFGASSFPVEREQYVPKNVEVNYIEGSNDKKWSSRDFLWTKKLEDNNKKVFGNHSFRPNQREVINATMSGHDVFVLMPTGGGKSLTYQANIPAAYLSANMEWTEQQEILRELSSDYCKYKLLYVTPEKVAKSDVLLRHLDSTYARESLARIVIDEAHCVSQWGHDFRPDYQGLGILKQKFPNTPVLGLTATATASVKEDVVQALGLVNCIVFRQSFNRPNLCYSVIPKTKKCVEDIDGFIKKNHFDECGIIYCLSRMDCEKVAEKLQECGHKAAFYHGSMDPAQRAFIQKQWSKDEINIICATVAFGMGINKPDVRFVIHHSLPKSIEGYHQECGRAGRDGQHSSCVLYYSYSDYIRVQHMITQGAVEQSPMPSGYKNQLFVNLWNWTILQVEVVKLTGQQFSSSHILEVYRGSLSQFVKKHKHNTLKLHGAGKHLTKSEASRILHHLVVADFLVEDVKKSDIYGSLSSILKVNESKACLLWSGGQKITLRFPSSDNASKLSKSGVPPAKGSLISGRQSPPQMEIPSQPQSEVDSVLSAKLYSALRKLRTGLLKESDNQGLTAYHIFGNATLQAISRKIPRTKEELLDVHGIGNVKLTKYGDRVLETIEATIKEHNMAEKNSSGSNGSSDSVKRRRDAARVSSGDSKDDGDFMESTGRSKKRTLTKPIKTPKFVGFREADSYNEYADVDPDCYGSDLDMENSVSKATVDNNDGGRVLPSWSMPLP
ncbi:DNA helicase [Actinidia rufa]|uniref:DNA 3'-5' helicase n=1 Tax=Actinidia rufa TaxID=165716 RepID=A0A7J0EQR9_9ERIC|nr:DNA helicase [Actinidia rufa]